MLIIGLKINYITNSKINVSQLINGLRREIRRLIKAVNSEIKLSNEVSILEEGIIPS